MSNTQQEIATPTLNTKNKVRSTQAIEFGTTKWLTYTALFTALALMMKVLGQFGTFSEISKLTLIYTIWLVAAAVLGPVGGGTVCFISDLLIALVFPTGVINPFITIVCTLYGILAGLIIKYLPIKYHSVRIIVAGLVCAALCTFVLNSYAIWGWCKYYLKLKSFMEGGKNGAFGLYMTTRLFQFAVAAANSFIAAAMVPLLTRLKLLPPVKKGKNGKAAKAIQNKGEVTNA